MKYQLKQKVIVNGRIAVVQDYNIRHKEYTVEYSNGTRDYGVKENEIQSVRHPFVITIEVNVNDDLEAYDMVESILTDERIKVCYIEPGVDEEIVEQIADDIKRRTMIKMVK